MRAWQGRGWFIAERGEAGLLPRPTPEGAFHHDGQPALYLATSAEGALFLARRQQHPADPPRVIVPVAVRLSRLADPGADLRRLPPWAEARRGGGPVPGWALADRARAEGAEAMTYADYPAETFLVIFADPRAVLGPPGPPRPVPPPPPEAERDLYR